MKEALAMGENGPSLIPFQMTTDFPFEKVYQKSKGLRQY